MRGGVVNPKPESVLAGRAERRAREAFRRAHPEALTVRAVVLKPAPDEPARLLERPLLRLEIERRIRLAREHVRLRGRARAQAVHLPRLLLHVPESRLEREALRGGIGAHPVQRLRRGQGLDARDVVLDVVPVRLALVAKRHRGDGRVGGRRAWGARGAMSDASTAFSRKHNFRRFW